MRILFVNSVCGVGSTGRICCDLADKLTAEGNECKIAYGRGKVPVEYTKYAYKIGSFIDVYWHVLMTRLFDRHGLASKMSTRKFIKWANDFNPDVLWLHNIHGYYINYEILFSWIKSRPNMKVKWTLHDCWAFTGHCAYFSYVGCNKWKHYCENCLQINKYPKSLFIENSYSNFFKKKNSFSNVDNLKLIVPSEWLKNLLADSFLYNYPTKVQYNKVDEGIFKPTKSDIREDLGLNNRIIVLGVANVWDKRKGLDDFIKLSNRLSEKFIILLIGLSNTQINKLPTNIIGLSKITDKHDLAKYYSIADVLVNPTKEDNYPTVNIEAQLCGCKVITYNTGGCAETNLHMNDFIVVEPNINMVVDNLHKMFALK